MYNRTFILLTALFVFGVQQVNTRAFFKKLYGVISDCYNDFLFCLGIISSMALPLIGIFDMYMWGPEHGKIAVVVFGGYGIYLFLLGRALYQNRDKYPAEEQ
jgi:hypothetical protein